MNEGLKFNIGADITGLEKGIQDSQKELQNLAQTIKTSTGEPIKAATDNIKKLDNELKITAKTLSGIKDPSITGSNALSALGNVARDLPFGFVAIQNNIPAVFDAFGSLSKKAGGAKEAFSAVAESITGPEGISFAFGIAIAGLTALSQKYGGLGKAFDNFFSDVETATADQILLTEATSKAAGGIENEKNKIDILVNTISNLKAPQKERLSAYQELKKISPDIVAGINAENISSNDSIKLLQAQAKIRKELLQLKITESGINAVLSQNAADLSVANVNLTKAQSDVDNALRKYNESQKQTNALVLQAQKGESAEALTLGYKRAALEEAKKTVADLISTQKLYLNQLDPIIKNISVANAEIDKKIKRDKDQKDSIDKLSKANNKYFYELQSVNGFISKDEKLTYQQRLTNLQNYANTILNVKNTESERKKALEQANKENNNFFESFKIGVTSLEVFKIALNSQAAVLQENIINQEAYNNSVKSLIPTFDVLAMRQEERNKQLKEQKALLTEFKAPTITAPQGLPTNLLSDDIVKATKEQQDAINKNISNYQAAYNIINDTFFNPLQDLFSNFLSTGKLAFADFGKAVLKAIQQIVAKIIATGVIALIGTLLTGGFSAAAGGAAGGFGKVGELVAGSLGFSLGGGKVAAPSFAGIGGGTLGMSGSVNVVLRGSDLVGSINRTNATISRVG